MSSLITLCGFQQVRNDVPIGEVIGQVLASDSDGSAPGNQVSYALDEESSSVRTEMYFLVDDSSGEIIVKDDLSKELLEEYRVSVEERTRRISDIQHDFVCHP